MADVDSTSVLESLLLAIPGCATPIGRVAVFGGAGAAVAYGLRPSMSFDATGKARPWIVFAPNDTEATLFPWWAFIALPAIAFGVLI